MNLKALMLLAFSIVAFAAEEPSMKLIGELETRPTWDSLTGVFRTENSAEAGAVLSPKVSLSYLQAVLTNVYNPQAEADQGGLNAALDDGFIRTRVKDLLNDGNGLSLSYQNRAYLPVNEGAQKAENLLVIRNYFTLSKKVSEVVTLSVSEIPILYINGKAGVDDKANNVFQNRIYLVADIQITEKLGFSFPLMFYQSRTANYADTAKNNNQWVHSAYIYPEFSYAVGANYNLGLAYYNSTSLIAGDLSGIQIGKGLENGAYQLVFGAKL